ncbi:MAG: hypothetical protein AB8H86_33270 [Polyangiales bacterium]
MEIRPPRDAGHFVIGGVRAGSASMAQGGSDALIVDSESDALALQLATVLGATCVGVMDD